MFAPLIIGVIALYLLLGWLILTLVNTRGMAEHRKPAAFVLAVLLWPVTVVVDLLRGRGSAPPTG